MADKTAAFWLRVSTPDQLVENQAPALERMAESRGLTVVQRYELRGRSAYRGAQLSDIEDVLADARDGHFRYLIVWALDRLSRGGIEEGLRIVREFEAAGLTVISCQEPWLESSSDDRDLLIAVSGHSAKAESTRRGERIKASRERRLCDNRWPGGKPPYAYMVADDGTLIAVLERIKVVRLIFKIYVGDRQGIDQIRRQLRELGIPSPTSKPVWSRNGVSGVLFERAYAHGVYEYNDARIPSEAFIEPDLFERAQVLRKSNLRLRHSADGKIRPLTGMKCSECGSPFLTDSGSGRPRTYYDGGRARNSRHALETGDRCMAVPRLKADVIELLTYNALREVFLNPKVFIDLALAPRRAELQAMLDEYNDDDSLSIDAQETGLWEREARLAEDWVQGALSEKAVADIRARIEEEKATLAEKRAMTDPERLREHDRARAELERLDLGARDWERIARWRDETGLPMGRLSVHPAAAESDELIFFRDADLVPSGQVTPDDVPVILAEWLSRLHADLIAYPDHIEIRGQIDFDVSMGGDQNAPRQASHSGRGLG